MGFYLKKIYIANNIHYIDIINSICDSEIIKIDKLPHYVRPEVVSQVTLRKYYTS